MVLRMLLGAYVSVVASDWPVRAHEPDAFHWLEEVSGEKPLAWAKKRNAETVGELCESDAFLTLQDRLLGILDSDDKIPYVQKIGGLYYNFWRDAKNPRGLWRRTTLQEYRKPDPNWEIVIDLDALAESEGENWVWHGTTVLRPKDRQCIVALSRGGADADVNREFDLETKQFVDGGFVLPEAKSQIAWRDADRLYVATDFGPGSMTTSGYPRVVKEWKRGTSLEDAVTLFECQSDDMVAYAYRDLTPGFERDFVVCKPTFWTTDTYLRRDGSLTRIEVPEDAKVSAHRQWLLVELRSNWEISDTTYVAGSLLAIEFDAFLEGDREFDILFNPTERKSLAGHSSTRNHLILNELDNVRNRLYTLTPPIEEGASWARLPLPGVPDQVTASASAVDDMQSDAYFLKIDGYLTPPALALGTVGQGPAAELKKSPAFFNTDSLQVTQHEATSKDGTRIPYFQVAAKDLPYNGMNETLLYGYGGFEISLVPGYSPHVGIGWLERGGVYVVANIRGGGEFGPRWHQAALKANRHKAYEDFIAVAEDLERRKVTKPSRLGIMGGSNGGLLVGNMLTKRPGLFRAIVCQVPLLDMRRYHTLLAGASWMAEYGNPDLPEEWAFIKTYSPFHNVKSDETYPRTLFTTSTRDDRVHPAHARKMVAKMRAQGHDVLYYENIEGGHGGAANNKQRAFMTALAYTFLWNELE